MADFTLISDRIKRRIQAGESSFVPGSFDLWFPFIELGSNDSIGDALRRFVMGNATSQDKGLFCTFFHEYLHLLQSALYFVCQLPVIRTHSIIYDVRVTAMERKRTREKKLLPVMLSNETKQIDKILRVEFEEIPKEDNYKLREGFSVLNILEGVARLLEEAYKGGEVENGHWRYSAISELNISFLKDKALSSRSLLELCDLVLRRRTPAKLFLEILHMLSLSKQDTARCAFDEFSDMADCLGYEPMPSQADMIITNTKRIFSSSLFTHYARQIALIYSRLPELYKDKPIFSSIYDEVSHDNGNGLPMSLLKMIYQCGSPVIVNAHGEMEVFDLDISHVSAVDQNIIGIKAVVQNIVDNGKSKSCLMREACLAASGHGSTLPVDENCISAPWEKAPQNGMICPYLAIWKAFGLEGLTL